MSSTILLGIVWLLKVQHFMIVHYVTKNKVIRTCIYIYCLLCFVFLCYTPSGGQKMLMPIYVIVENHLLCKFKYDILAFNKLYVCCICRRTKKDSKRNLFKICPKPREKQCKPSHFALANRLLNPKVSHKGMYIFSIILIRTRVNNKREGEYLTFYMPV